MDKQIKKSVQGGFSLMEVMVAITLFALFITAFLTSQGYNVSDSELNHEQIILQSLAEQRINQLMLDPPKFTRSDESLKETRGFEDEQFKDYEYTLELKKLVIPDFGQLFSKSADRGDEGGDQSTRGQDTRLQKMIFDELKKNIEKILWQARVTVRNKQTNYSFSLSTYLTNYNERVELNVGI